MRFRARVEENFLVGGCIVSGEIDFGSCECGCTSLPSGKPVSPYTYSSPLLFDFANICLGIIYFLSVTLSRRMLRFHRVSSITARHRGDLPISILNYFRAERKRYMEGRLKNWSRIAPVFRVEKCLGKDRRDISCRWYIFDLWHR